MLKNIILAPNIFAPTPKITRKTPFCGPFSAKPIIERAPRKSHVNACYEAETLQLYRYRQVLEGMGCFKFFPLGGVRGAGPLNANLGTQIISETTGARK